MVIGVSINIFVGFTVFVFLNNIVSGLNVSEFNQMYEILDDLSVIQLLARQRRLIWLVIQNPKTVPNMSVHRPDSLFQEQLGA